MSINLFLKGRRENNMFQDGQNNLNIFNFINRNFRRLKFDYNNNKSVPRTIVVDSIHQNNPPAIIHSEHKPKGARQRISTSPSCIRLKNFHVKRSGL